MKIAILVPSFLPKWLAGTEIATYNMASHLTKNGHEIHVITSWDSGLPEEGTEQGFFVHRLKLPKIKFIGLVIFWFEVLVVLRKIDPDMIHVQRIDMAIPAFLARKFMKKPYAVWGQGFDVYFPWRFKKTISKLVFKNADVVIAQTENMKKHMQEIFNREVFIIPNGIDVEKFKNSPAKEMIRNILGLDNSNRVIIFVGNLRPVKGVKYLIQAMSTIVQKEVNARLILVGKGQQSDYLKNLAKEFRLEKYVIFVEEVPHEKVPEYLTASDIFVLPSLSEGFSIVSMEAMASGLPIIATKVGVLPEIIEEGVNGFLIESEEPRKIAEKVLYLLGDDDLRKRISENNKEKAKSYSWTSIVQRLEEVYQYCLEA